MPEISVTAIQEFLAALPESALSAAPPSNLPTTIPLAWPSDMHQLNFLATLHLSHAAIAQPQHSALLAEIGEHPSDVALRGCLGLYLGSGQAWDANNYLSARAWRDGALDEARVAEYFGITILRERQHETLPIRVGERYPPAVALVADLCSLFLSLGESIDASCVGEDVVALLTASKEHTASEPEPAFFFAKDFCHRATSLIPMLADFYPDPPGDVLPAAPLRLLQDLAHAFPNHAAFSLPAKDALADVSPLPLPVGLLLHTGILQPDSSPEGDALRRETIAWWPGKKRDLFAPAEASPRRDPKVIKLSKDVFVALARESVEACSEIASHARFGATAPQWEKKLTRLDISRVCAMLDEALDAHGMGVRLVLE